MTSLLSITDLSLTPVECLGKCVQAPTEHTRQRWHTCLVYGAFCCIPIWAWHCGKGLLPVLPFNPSNSPGGEILIPNHRRWGWASVKSNPLPRSCAGKCRGWEGSRLSFGNWNLQDPVTQLTFHKEIRSSGMILSSQRAWWDWADWVYMSYADPLPDELECSWHDDYDLHSYIFKISYTS